jgi:putative protease
MALLKDRTNNALSSKMAMNRAEIIVKVNNAAQAEAALNAGADRIILNGDVLLPDRPWSTETVLALYQRAEENGQQLYVGLPRMLWNAQITNEWLAFDACCHGYSAGNFGALAHMRATDKPIHADFSLNTYNHLASDVFKAMGAQSVTLSVELKQHELMALLKRARDIVVVYGRLATMYFEHDFYEAMAYEGEIPLTLKNEGGSY